MVIYLAKGPIHMISTEQFHIHSCNLLTYIIQKCEVLEVLEGSYSLGSTWFTSNDRTPGLGTPGIRTLGH